VRRAIGALLCAALATTACQREQRRFSDSRPRDAERSAWAVAEGKRLYQAFNCDGCHGRGGGGGMGPPLMDAAWIYGVAPDNVYASIVRGRPNGMPAFGGRVTESQAWQLVAYVRSLSGQPSRGARPGRDDHMQIRESEQARRAERPVAAGTPKPGR